MAICPANCDEIDLIANPSAGLCDENPRRKRSLYKIGFYLCSTTLPSELTCAALKTLVESKEVVFTSPLQGVEFGEPQIADVKMNDCEPASQFIVGRELTFNDRYKVTIPEIPLVPEGPEGDPPEIPAVPANPYGDLVFWKNKKQVSMQLRVMFLYCNGEIEIPKDEDGSPMQSTFLIYRAFDRVTEGNDENIYEIKRGTIRFKGDPLTFDPPALKIEGAGCEDLAELVGIAL